MVLDSLINKEARLLKKAEKLYSRAEKLSNSDLSQARSLLLEAMDEIEEKKSIIREKKKDFSILLANMGNLLSQLGDFKMGEKAFQNAMLYDSSNIWAYIYYSRALLSRKNYDQALRMVDKAITLNRKSKEAWETKADIYESMHDVDEVLKIYLNLIKMFPDELKYYDKYLKYKPNDAEVLMKKAMILYEKKDYYNAAITLENVIEISPGSEKAYVYLGASYDKLERYGDAIKSFRKAIEINPESKSAWLSLAVIYKKRGEYEDALNAVKEGIKIDPNDPKSYRIKAEIEYEMKNFGEALDSVNRALKIVKNDDKLFVDLLMLKRKILKMNYIAEEMADACYHLITKGVREIDVYYDLAQAYYNIGEYEKALQVIDTVLSTTPNHLPTLILQKDTYMKMGRWEMAIKSGEKILEVNPKDSETYADIARAYMAMEKYESALFYIKKATEISSKNIEFWKIQKDIAKHLNKPAEVVNACLGITSIVEDFDTLIDLAKAYYTLGRFGEAKKVMESALRIEDRADAWNLYGMINYKLKDFEEAKQAFEKATEKEPGVKKYWSNLGWILEKLEKYQEALEAFNRALEIDEGDPRVWFERGVCLEKMNEWEEALTSFRKAVEINPKFTKALMEMGNALMALEHYDEALKSYREVLKLDPARHEAFYKKALVEYTLGNYEACMKDIENALKYRKEEEYLILKKDCCKAIKNWNCVIEVSNAILDINARNADAYRDLAIAYLNVGKIDSAIETYRRAIEVFQENESFLYELKDILKKEAEKGDRSRYADLIEISKKILALNPQDYKTLVDIANAYMEIEHYDEAEDYLLRALNIRKDKEIFDSLGNLYLKKGDYKGAVKYYADSLKIENDPEIHYRLALAHYKMGELDFALSAIRKAIRKEKKAKYYLLGAKIYAERGESENAIKYGKKALSISDIPEIRLYLGKILVNSGENMEAIGVLKPIAKDAPEDIRIKAMSLLALAEEREGRYDEALALYREILKADRNNVDAYLGLGRINMALEKYEEAKDAYTKALEIDPKSRETCETLAFIYEKLGNLREAMKYLDRAIEIDPENKHLWSTKGRLLSLMKKYDEAKRAYEKALSIDSEFKPAMEGLKDVERKIEEERIEEFARKVLELEYKSGKKVTKKDAFKKLDIPLSMINRVFNYIRREEPFDMKELNKEDLERFEKATLQIAKLLNKVENIKLSEVIGNTKMSVKSAKRLIKYIESCLNSPPSDRITREDEILVKKALELNIENIDLLNLMINLDVGICKAKKIRKLLEDILREDEEEYGNQEEYEMDEESNVDVEEPEEEYEEIEDQNDDESEEPSDDGEEDLRL